MARGLEAQGLILAPSLEPSTLAVVDPFQARSDRPRRWRPWPVDSPRWRPPAMCGDIFGEGVAQKLRSIRRRWDKSLQSPARRPSCIQHVSAPRSRPPFIPFHSQGGQHAKEHDLPVGWVDDGGVLALSRFPYLTRTTFSICCAPMGCSKWLD